MTVNLGQITYSLFPPQADPGQLADNTVNRFWSMPAASAVYPGRVLEPASDGVSCQMVQDTGSTAYTSQTVLGCSILLTAREGTGAVSNTIGNVNGAVFNPGDMVPVLRRGALFGEWAGTTQTALGTPNVKHSSTTPANQGVFTDAAPSGTAGSEVSALPKEFQVKPPALAGTGSIVLVEVNFPGA